MYKQTDDEESVREAADVGTSTGSYINESL